MRNVLKAALSTAALATAISATPAFAQEEAGDLTISGNVALTSEYRLRGISQSDGDLALQGGITVAHSSGLYVGTWASSLAGYGSFGGSNTEVDLIGGYSTDVGGATLDGGLVYYIYPGVSGINFLELYGSVSGALGPVDAKLGTYWAPKQSNLGGHNIWIYSDIGVPISGTPFTLKGHVGYSDGNTGYTQGGDVFDYAVGVDASYQNLTLNVSYVGTDIGKARSVLWDTTPGKGRDITKGKVVATLSASF